MPESLQTRLTRWYFNFHPNYRGTGAWVTYIAADWSEIRIRLPLNWQTRNIVGVIFGGSLYAAVDPMYMIMLMRRLGPNYIVWDKAATIRFIQPGRSTLQAVFHLTDEDVALICRQLETQPRLDPVFTVDLVDRAGVVHASVEKVIYIRKK